MSTYSRPNRLRLWSKLARRYLRDPRVTSALLGASSVKQLEQNVAALSNLDFDPGELEEIDRHAVDGGINLWEPSSTA